MTNSFSAGAFPFVNDDDAISAAPGTKDKALRNSMVHSSRDSETDSFVSAVESPSQLQRAKAEEKLRAKKQKAAEKKFKLLRESKSKLDVGKEFGDLADIRASDPVTITQRLKKVDLQKTAERGKTTADQRIDEDYFNKHFAHTPTAQA